MADSADSESGRARKRDNTPLATRPDLVARVHPEDRERAMRLSLGSPEVVRWVCDPHGHLTRAQIRARAKTGAECAYCKNKKVLVGFNDVATKAPALVAEWHPTRNEGKTPQDYTYGSPARVWWRCSNGHEWQAQIRHRVGLDDRPGTGCRDCKGLRRVRKSDDGTVTDVNGKSVLDVWPEVTGWWEESNPHPPESVHQTDRSVEYAFRCPAGHLFHATAATVLSRKNHCLICTGREVAPGVNTLDVTHPALAAEWDVTANGCMASQVTWANRNSRSWICPLGHSYTAPVRSRVEQGTGCTYCHGRAVLPGFNDVATTYPSLVGEWADERDPSTVYKHSTDYVTWKCQYEHEWTARVVDRAVGGTGCPFCDGKRPVVGVNDLATTHPEIAKQWLRHKNGDLTPQDVTIGSGREAWWHVQDCGHTWKAPIRTRKNAACGQCAKGIAISGLNDVATTHPGIVGYFRPTANPGVDLTTKTAGSGQTLNWSCPRCAHTWSSPIRSFPLVDEFCPRCSGREPIPGVNDAATLHPHLVAEIDQDVHPATVLVGMSPGNGARIAWRCSKGHKWDTRLVDRVHYKTACPDCVAATWTSRGEDEVAAYIESLGLTVQRGVWLSANGGRSNYDIFIPECNTYVEYNGLYFHSEGTGKGRDYHAAKLRTVRENGGTLLAVWEDDWIRKPRTVKRFLAHKLNRSDQPKTYARNTTVTTIDHADADTFLSEYHLQGPVGAALRFALLDTDDEIVAAMLLRIQGAEAAITRFATSRLVPGGFSKLLHHANAHLRDNSPGVTHVKTFSDNLISDGTLYASAGFDNDGQVPPDYTYFRGRGPRLHKFNLRVARFQKDPALRFEPDKTERELAVMNGFHRVWDAGKTRWILPLQAP